MGLIAAIVGFWEGRAPVNPQAGRVPRIKPDEVRFPGTFPASCPVEGCGKPRSSVLPPEGEEPARAQYACGHRFSWSRSGSDA